MYDQFRNILIEKVISEYGPDVVKGYSWDTLPTSYPCVGDCMTEHLHYRSRRDISPSDPAVLYLPLGMFNNNIANLCNINFLYLILSIRWGWG